MISKSGCHEKLVSGRSSTDIVAPILPDLRQICRVGRTTTVDDRSETSFSIPQGTLPWQPNSVGFYCAMPCIRGNSHGPVSVCVCLCLSVRSRCSTKTAKHTITQTKPRDSSGTLVFWCQRSSVYRWYPGDIHNSSVVGLFLWHDASRGPSAIAELLVIVPGCRCLRETVRVF